MARTVSVALHPLVLVYVVLVPVGAHLAGVAGAGWGLLAATFAAGVPGLLLWRATRRGQVVDMDVSRREQRPLVLALALVSLLVGVVLLVVTGAPRALLVLLLAMGAGLVVAAVVSLFWKASVHTACATGAGTVFAWFGLTWAAVAFVPLAVLVALARVRTGAHDGGQVLVGAVIGVLVPVVVLGLGRA